MMGARCWVWLFAVVALGVAEDVSSYVQLDANNFQVEVDSRDIMVVCFYHSRGDLEDELPVTFVDAAVAMSASFTGFGVVDSAFEKTLQKKYEIEDFPAVRIFRDGKVYHYRRAIEQSALVEFITGLMKPAVATLNELSAAVEMTESDNAVVIGFFSPENVKEYEVFLHVASDFQANDNHNVEFAEVVNPEVIKQFQIVYTPMVFLFRPDEGAVGYVGMFEQVELHDWVTVSTTPTLRELTPETFLHIFEDNTPTLLAFVDKADTAKTSSLLKVLTEASVRFLHKLNFVFTERTHFVGLAEKMGVPNDVNTVTIMDFHKREHFVLEGGSGEVTVDEVAKFCDGFLANTLHRAEDGEVMALDPDGVPETVVIANPTEELMMDFYVPWCDFYINIGVPHSGVPRVSLLSSPPDLDHLNTDQPKSEK